MVNVGRRDDFANSLNYFSPTLVTQHVFNTLGGSSMRQMLDYDTSAWHYFKLISRYTDDMIFLKNNRAGSEDFEKMPLYAYKPVIDSRHVAQQIIVLLAFGLALLFLSGFITSRK